MIIQIENKYITKKQHEEEEKHKDKLRKVKENIIKINSHHFKKLKERT